jgi:hypothetical protein
MKKFHNTSFLIGKKIFALTKGDGVVVKLPKEKIKELVDRVNVEPLVMGIRVMKEWVIIKYKDPDEYKRVLGLFKEAMAFVSLKAGKKMSIFLRIHNLLATNSPNRVSQSQPRMVQ